MTVPLGRASRVAVGVVLLLGAAAFYLLGFYPSQVSAEDADAAAAGELIIYKSPTCGCCGDWVDHVEQAGFGTDVRNSHAMSAVKQEVGIEPRYQSCHTAVSAEGYFFEGHVPAKFVEQFLKEKPENAVGLAVPGMPVGSPGMEVGERFDSYEVIQVNRDGTTSVYAEVEKPEDQY